MAVVAGVTTVHTCTSTELQRLGFTPGKFLDLPSGKTHYLLVGPETGELIVLFHGFAIFTFVWQQLLEPLISLTT